jgi:hypothetical protein
MRYIFLQKYLAAIYFLFVLYNFIAYFTRFTALKEHTGNGVYKINAQGALSCST